MRDEWQPLIAACLIALCVAIGIGVGISPHSPWLPYKMAVHDQGRDYYENGRKNGQNAKSGSDAASPEKFEGHLRANPDNCYQGEHEGDCAARVVQEGISHFYLFLTIAAAVSAVAAGMTGVAVFKQVNIARNQHGIMVQQASIMQAQADLETPRLFCEIRDQNFVEVTETAAAKLYPTHDTVTMRAPPVVTFRLRNFGRSPAILRFINAKVDRKQTPPSEDTPYVLTNLPPERVLGRDEVTSDVTAGMSIFKAPLKRSEYDMLMRGQTYWWFFGSVGFNDVWGGKSALHFCWRYDQGIRVFDPYPPERNYTERMQRSEKRPHGPSPEP